MNPAGRLTACVVILGTHFIFGQVATPPPAYKPDDVCTFTSQTDVPTAMRDGR
jgi:hypothetical protein